MPTAEMLTIQVSAEAQHTIRTLAEKMARSDREIVERAVEELRRKLLFEDFNAAYAALLQQPEVWSEIKREHDELDTASADGLEPEDWSEYANSHGA